MVRFTPERPTKVSPCSAAIATKQSTICALLKPFSARSSWPQHSDDKSEYQYLNFISMFRNILPYLNARFHAINDLDQSWLFALYKALGYSISS
jgi:hypothetical protein